MKNFTCFLLFLFWAAIAPAQTKSEIQQAQHALKQLGLYQGQADGIYGQRTAAAVRGFQGNNALAITGKLDSLTLLALAQTGSSKPPSPSRISIFNAVRDGLLEAKVSGSDIQYVELQLSSKVDYVLDLDINAGTYFVCNSGAQNMVSRQAKHLTLRPNAHLEVSLEAACANRPKDIPGSNDQFEIAPSPHQAELSALMPLLEKKNARYTTVQAAVWIVTDNADFGDLGILSDGYGRAIDCDDAVLAMQYCQMAGIDITQKSIWRDRVYLQGCVSTAALKNWLKNQK